MDANHKQSTTPIYHRCTICHRLYKNPKHLPCSHSYCEGCLVKFNEGPYVMSEASTALLSASVTVTAHGQVGKEIKFTIFTKDEKHYPRYNRSDKITAEAKPRTGNVILAEIKDNQDGSYTASLVPTQPGEMEILVFVNGKTVEDQTFSVQVCQYSAVQHGKIFNSDGEIRQPWGIAFGQDGVWAVVNRYNHCVCIFDHHDQLTGKFGSEGNGNCQLKYPCGIAFDSNNNLYVVDYNNHRVQKFDISGEYLLQFGKCGSGYGQLSNPVGITVCNDRVFVADKNNNRISVFQCDGQFSHTFGSHQLNPFDVAINNNQVFVVSYHKHCISIFTLDGNYVSKIGAL